MLTDGLGNPLHFLLSSGNRNDICLAREILEPFELTGKLVLADKGYDSDKFIRWIKERGGIPVIRKRLTKRRTCQTQSPSEKIVPWSGCVFLRAVLKIHGLSEKIH